PRIDRGAGRALQYVVPAVLRISRQVHRLLAPRFPLLPIPREQKRVAPGPRRTPELNVQPIQTRLLVVGPVESRHPQQPQPARRPRCCPRSPPRSARPSPPRSPPSFRHANTRTSRYASGPPPAASPDSPTPVPPPTPAAAASQNRIPDTKEQAPRRHPSHRCP